MNRREFIKSAVALAVVPALPILAVAKKNDCELPANWGKADCECTACRWKRKSNATVKINHNCFMYGEFDIKIDTVVKPYFGTVKQICASIPGECHLASVFDEHQADAEIWKLFKPVLDRAIERHNGRKHLSKCSVLGVGK